MDNDRLHFLLQRHFDQLLTVDDRAELERMLLESARAREEFWEMARWNALLRQWGQSEWGRRDAAQPAPLRVLELPASQALKPVSGLGLAGWWRPIALAALLALGFFLFFFSPWPRSLQPLARHSSASKVAVLARTFDAVWEDNPHSAGDALQPGWLHLQKGAAQIEFARGAHVVLEAPAELRIVSGNEAFLRSGKLRARVPPSAHGFKVVAPDFNVTDYGTEFGCFILSGAAELHVFAGSVGLQNGDAAAVETVREDNALRLSGGKMQSIPADSSAFLTEEELAARIAVTPAERLAAWRKASRILGEHPSALVHLDFEGEDNASGLLQNRARNASNSIAKVIGCKWNEGRWPGKRAVEFKNVEDRVQLNIPGNFDSITLLAWVRVESLPPGQASLMMTDTYLPGDIHWYLYRDGRIGLSAHGTPAREPQNWRVSYSDPVISAQYLNKWICIASVFNGATHTVAHYFNGEPVGTVSSLLAPPLRIGAAELGNWAVRPNDPRWSWLKLRGPWDYVRNLHGRMDEFAIFSTAFEADKIKRFYLMGQPGG